MGGVDLLPADALHFMIFWVQSFGVHRKKYNKLTWYRIVNRANGAVAVLDTAPATPPESSNFNVSRTSCRGETPSACRWSSSSVSRSTDSSSTAIRRGTSGSVPSFAVSAASSTSSFQEDLLSEVESKTPASAAILYAQGYELGH